MYPDEAVGEVTMVDAQTGERIHARETVEVEVVASETPPAPEEPKNYWEENGYLPDIARVCTDLEGERERFLFSASVRQHIETINNAQRIEDFDRFSIDQLREINNILRSEVPEVERGVISFVSQLSRARAVEVDSIDFI